MEGAMALQPLLSIGELARRTGLSVSAIRFYEARGLVKAVRTAGNQRRFARADLRRLSFALIAQKLGLTLGEVAAELSTLPLGRAPTRADWQAISNRIRAVLQQRIAMLERTRDRLDGCIGCGCLSLDRCALYNPGDRAAQAGPGPRFLLGDRPGRLASRPRPGNAGPASTARGSRARTRDIPSGRPKGYKVAEG
jgi:MerR family redox-sensitive transcriptional activator SoxR